jgi:hypothetical protein
LPADVVKTLTLVKPKKQRAPEIIEREKTIVSDYVKGKEIRESSHQGILALKELLKHQNVNVQLSE